MKTVFFCALVLLGHQAFSSEGFNNIDQQLTEPLKTAFLEFPVDADCGSVRIHTTKQYYLSALHCLRHEIESHLEREETIGDHFNYDFLVYYKNLTDKIVQIGARKLKILASGSCWTGFGLDVIEKLSDKKMNEAVSCAAGDWVIFELQSSEKYSTTCVQIADSYNVGDEVISLGGPRTEVIRSSGKQKLSGRVFSKGTYFSFEKLVNHPNYPQSLAPLVEKIRITSDLEKAIGVTSADAVNGMSGGPTLTKQGLIGVNTLGLLPNYIGNFPGTIDVKSGYTFGIHGFVKIQSILSSIGKMDFFSCQNQ